MQLARQWSEHLGTGDVLARWGGEEFAIMFAETGLARATAVVHDPAHTTPDSLTFSVGLLRITEPLSLDAALTATDKLLYVAKGSGRSCLACATTMSGEPHANVSNPMVEPLFEDRLAEGACSALEVAGVQDVAEALLQAGR